MSGLLSQVFVTPAHGLKLTCQYRMKNKRSHKANTMNDLLCKIGQAIGRTSQRKKRLPTIEELYRNNNTGEVSAGSELLSELGRASQRKRRLPTIEELYGNNNTDEVSAGSELLSELGRAFSEEGRAYNREQRLRKNTK
jgi:hypothetical protein